MTNNKYVDPMTASPPRYAVLTAISRLCSYAHAFTPTNYQFVEVPQTSYLARKVSGKGANPPLGAFGFSPLTPRSDERRFPLICYINFTNHCQRVYERTVVNL